MRKISSLVSPASSFVCVCVCRRVLRAQLFTVLLEVCPFSVRDVESLTQSRSVDGCASSREALTRLSQQQALGCS